MIRFICSILAGYLTMAICIGVVFSAVFIAPNFAFQANSRDVTLGWIVYTMLASFFAAMAGGGVTTRLARSQRAGVILAGLVLVLGVVSAFGNETRRQQARPPYSPSESVIERATHAVQPTAYAFIAPFVGAAGTLLGTYGSMRKGTRNISSDG